MLFIEEVTNDSTSETSISVQTSGVANGTVTFWVSRTPDATSRTVTTITSDTNGTYVIETPHSDLWYIWVHDTDGYGPQMFAVWSGYTGTTDLDEVGNTVRDILIDNKTGIDAGLKIWYPNIEVKQIIYGYEGNITDFPSILIHAPRLEARYVGFPYMRELTYRLSIETILMHSDEQSELGNVTRFAEIVLHILNNPTYADLTLANGVGINYCQATGAGTKDFKLGSYGYVASGSMEWYGLGISIDGGF
jgi:hypothetical protein